MPTWEFKELELNNSFLSAEKRLTEDQLQDHTKHCGYIPRNVFTSYYTIIRVYADAVDSVTNKHDEVSSRKDGEGGYTKTNWEDFEGLPERIFALQVDENYFEADICYHNKSMGYDVAKYLMSMKAMNLFLGTKF